MTPPKVPFPSPTSKLRPRVDATVPDCLTMGVSDTPPCCAAHAPEGGGAPLDRDSTAPPLHFTRPPPTSTPRLRAAHRPECTRPRDGASYVRLGRFVTEKAAEFLLDPQSAKQPETRHLPDGTTHVRLVRLVRFSARGGACGIRSGSDHVWDPM